MRNFILEKSIRFLVLFLFIPFGLSAQVSVTGTIKDKNGEALIGVSVAERGTSNGTVTNVEGEYTLKAAANATLTFSYIGFTPQSIDLKNVNGDKHVLNVVLEEDTKALEEVVVIGYGTQRKEAVTGSVASMSGDILRDVASSGITQALEGRVAGVQMTQTNSRPGEDMQIRIRGTRSLNASNDPLVVLDGIPFAGTISDIDPNSIKSLDILKDASATAIYGSRGANGVIMVSTYKGIVGQKPTIVYNAYYGLQNAKKYPMMNGAEYSALRKLVGKYSNGLDESDDMDTDWQELFYRTGKINSHDIAISGSGEKHSYNFGFGYYNNEGVVPLQDFNRLSLRGSFDQEIGIFKFGIATNSNYSVKNGSHIGTYGVLSMSPIANPYNEDGTFRRTVRMALDEQWTMTRETLEAVKDSWLNNTKGFGSYNTLYGEVKIPGVEGLKYRVNLGLNFRMSTGGEYKGVGINSTNIKDVSTTAISNSLRTNWAVENLLTYDRTFGKHQINLVGMYSAEQTTYNRSSVTAKDIPADYFQYYNLGRALGEIAVNPNNQNYEQSALISLMGRAMYSYDNRYMISVALRSDASSRLAPGHQWHTYPAVSAGWNIKRENFMDNVTWLDLLKLRVGYGQTSNQSVPPYKTLGLLSTRPYNYGSNGYATGFYVSQLPNSELGWEYSSTWNFGLDFNTLSGRLSGSVEYYSMYTNNVLLSLSLPRTSGVGSYMANIGETSNKGFELSLNGIIIENKDGWNWDAGVNLYVNRNKLVSLTSKTGDDDVDNRWFLGYPIDVIYDFKRIGLWQQSEAEEVKLYEGTSGVPGMIKVEYTGEYNADGTPVRIIGSDDRQVISMEPNFQGGFFTTVGYKNIDLNIVGAFQNGGVLLSTLHASAGYLNMLSGRRGNVKVDYWTPENTGADKYPYPLGPMSGDNPKYGSTLGYFDASYLKIRSMTLGYNFSLEGLKKIGVNKLRAYITIQNPFVLFSPFHSETGMDPETNSLGDSNIAVESDVLDRLPVIGTNSPQTRNYMFGISLKF